MKTLSCYSSSLRPLVPLSFLVAAILACAPTPLVLTPNAVTLTPLPTLPSATPLATATQPLAIPATGTPLPPASPSPTVAAPCANLYLPTAAGSTWTYASSTSLSAETGGRTATTTKVGQASFFHDVQLLKPPLHYEVSWQCAPEGLIEYGGGILASLAAASKVKIDILRNTGVTLPAAILVGDTWSQTTEIQLTSDSLNGTGRWIADRQAAAVEDVTVPAGTFSALRIDGTLKSESDPYPSLNLTAEGSSWYAPNVGLIKNSGHIYGESADYTYELVLVSYQIP